jgi:cytochrome c553
MKKLFAAAILTGSAIAAGGVLYAAENPRPDWAYAIPTGADSESGPAEEEDDNALQSLPGTELQFTPAEIRGYARDNRAVQMPPADWHPEDHPPMPQIVAMGNPANKVRACAFCHYPNGKAYPATAGIAGLPKEYIVQQLHEFRDGVRHSAEPLKENVDQMIDIAKGMTEEEIDDAASYYASLQWTPWVRVVEAATVPLAWNRNGTFHLRTGSDAGMEPIGNRILEMAEDSARTALRDPHSGFVAYVPPGAIAKGEELVRTGGGKTIQCAICHGENLHGIGAVPGIAARSPSYVVRQLYDIQQGTRHGSMTALMAPVVANLSSEDMLNIAAYTASLTAEAPAP